MKFLKLQCEDMELYNVDNSTLKAEYLYTNMPAFRKLYVNQGESFWIRHILTLREYLYVLIQARFELEEGQCLHWIINLMEKTFIRIHRLMIVGGFDQAKKTIKLIKKTLSKLDLIPHVITNRQCRLITSKNVKIAFRTLFGSHLGHDKKAVIKAFLACGLYEHFCGSLGVLLKRCSVAIDMPSSFDDSSPNMQYWKPFAQWTFEEYEPNLFENYIARYYGDKLSNILLITDVHNLFSHNTVHKCCVSFIENYSARLIDEPNIPYSSKRVYIPCEHHRGCHIRVVHSESCKNPYFSCLNLPHCLWHCDTFCEENSKLIALKNKKGLWKHHALTVYKTSQQCCRDISIQVETFDSNVQTYLRREVTDNDCTCSDDSSDSPFMKALPPDLVNFAKQVKQKEKTKSRLRDKLFKKSKKETKIEDIFHCLPLENFEDSDYCSMLYLKAQKKLHEELSEDLLYKFFGNKIGQSDSPLMDVFEEHFEMELLIYNQSLASAPLKLNCRSIGVGCEIPLDIRFLTTPKTLHCRNREEKAFIKTDLVKDNILLTNDVTNSHKKTEELESSLPSQDTVNSVKNITDENCKENTTMKNTEVPVLNLDKINATDAEKKQEQLMKNKKVKKNKKKNDKKSKKGIDVDALQPQENSIIETNTKQLEHSVMFNNIEKASTSSSNQPECDEKIEEDENVSFEENGKKLSEESDRDALESVYAVHESASGCNITNNDKQMEERPTLSSGEWEEGRESPSIIDPDLPINRRKHNATTDVNESEMAAVNEKEIICNKTHREIAEDFIRKTAANQAFERPDELNGAPLNCQNSTKVFADQKQEGKEIVKNNEVLNTKNTDVENSGEEKNIKVAENPKKSSKFRICACCGKEEMVRKTFKKCKLCKTQQFEIQSYYCSVECQEADWRAKHRDEHRSRTNPSKPLPSC